MRGQMTRTGNLTPRHLPPLSKLLASIQSAGRGASERQCSSELLAARAAKMKLPNTGRDPTTMATVSHPCSLRPTKSMEPPALSCHIYSVVVLCCRKTEAIRYLPFAVAGITDTFPGPPLLLAGRIPRSVDLHAGITYPSLLDGDLETFQPSISPLLHISHVG